MNADLLKKQIDSLTGCITFEYLGKKCGIDAINHSHYEMWYDDDFLIAKSIDEVMTTKLFAGKSLEHICNVIENIDY